MHVYPRKKTYQAHAYIHIHYHNHRRTRAQQSRQDTSKRDKKKAWMKRRSSYESKLWLWVIAYFDWNAIISRFIYCSLVTIMEVRRKQSRTRCPAIIPHGAVDPTRSMATSSRKRRLTPNGENRRWSDPALFEKRKQEGQRGLLHMHSRSSKSNRKRRSGSSASLHYGDNGIAGKSTLKKLRCQKQQHKKEQQRPWQALLWLYTACLNAYMLFCWITASRGSGSSYQSTSSFLMHQVVSPLAMRVHHYFRYGGSPIIPEAAAADAAHNINNQLRRGYDDEDFVEDSTAATGSNSFFSHQQSYVSSLLLDYTTTFATNNYLRGTPDQEEVPYN